MRRRPPPLPPGHRLVREMDDGRYPILFECARLFDVQENTPGAGGETPSYSVGGLATAFKYVTFHGERPIRHLPLLEI